MITANFRLLKITIAVGLCISLAACQGTVEKQASDVSHTQESSVITHENQAAGGSMNLNQQLSFAKKDLADRLGIDQESITIKAARQVTWNSGALGCPKPGMSYTQALVPGVLILFDVSGKPYGYHAQKGGKPFHCPTKQAVIPKAIQKEDLA